MKRLKQIEETKKMISDALLRLLQNKLLDEITVSEITIEARIGRNTFYNHFQKKEDVLVYLMEGLRNQLKDRIDQVDMISKRDLLIWRFRLLKENQLLAVFHDQNEIKQLFFRFRDSNIPLVDFSSAKSTYRKDFIQGGIDYVTSRWIIGGMKESPEEMADTILSIMNR